MTQLFLDKEMGYPWYSDQSDREHTIFFRGYFFHEGQLFRGAEAVKRLKSLSPPTDLTGFLRELNGSFAIVTQYGAETVAAVDIARSTPLYVSSDGRFLSDSSERLRKELGLPAEDVDPLRLAELYAKRYVAGNHTVYGQILQPDIGQLVHIRNGVVSFSYYYRHIQPIEHMDAEQAKRRFAKVSEHVFERLKETVGDRPVILSLSGGYDSRYVACMLKKVGVENVSCYTYGKPDSFEVKTSRDVAEKLGYRWICVEHTDERVAGLLSGDTNYYKQYLEHDAMPYLQNLLAVQHLHDTGWFSENAVCITGLCADMPTGNYVPGEDETANWHYNDKLRVDQYYQTLFTRFSFIPDIEKKFKESLRDQFQFLSVPCSGKQDYVRSVDCLNTGESHARFFLGMNKVHEAFGYEWLLPCWDREFLEFWYALPYLYRIGQNLYEDYLMTILYPQFGVDQKKTKVVYSGNKIKKALLYAGGAILVRVSFLLGKPFRRRYDFNNFAPLEYEMYKKIHNKDMIRWRKAGFSFLLALYSCEQRYGANAVKCLKNWIAKG